MSRVSCQSVLDRFNEPSDHPPWNTWRGALAAAKGFREAAASSHKFPKSSRLAGLRIWILTFVFARFVVPDCTANRCP
jgi:hypothetical protein